MSTPNALIRALWWLALPVAGVLAWKAWDHNLAMLCSDRQWPWPTFCAEPGAEEPPVREQVARLQARVSAIEARRADRDREHARARTADATALQAQVYHDVAIRAARRG